MGECICENIWVIQTITSGGNIAKKCIEKNIAAVGWSIDDKILDKDNNILFNEYIRIAENKYSKRELGNVIRLAENVKENDLIWMRNSDKGVYYIGRKNNNSIWNYSNDKDDIELDMQNQLSNIDWHRVGDESAVPGVISIHFHKRGQTFHKIQEGKISANRFSTYIYNKMTSLDFYSQEKLENNKENLFNLLSPNEVEDLLYFYLENKYKYIIVPSTNKIGTPKYEYVLMDRNNGENIYVQCKNGKGPECVLRFKDYDNLSEDKKYKVYLFSRAGVEHNSSDNIVEITEDDLYNWVYSENEDILLSDTINNWIDYLADKEMNGKKKGVIIDTNQTYYPNDELDMISKKMVWAKGNPKRYIYSLNKGDYVLYYSSGKGIIAVGKVLDESAKEIEDNGLAKNVKILFPNNKDIEIVKPLAANQLKMILKKNFFFATTMKKPFLSEEEVKIIIDELNKINIIETC